MLLVGYTYIEAEDITRIRTYKPFHTLNGLSGTIDSKRECGEFILITPTYGFSILCISIVSLIFKIIDKRQIPCD